MLTCQNRRQTNSLSSDHPAMVSNYSHPTAKVHQHNPHQFQLTRQVSRPLFHAMAANNLLGHLALQHGWFDQITAAESKHYRQLQLNMLLPPIHHHFDAWRRTIEFLSKVGQGAATAPRVDADHPD